MRRASPGLCSYSIIAKIFKDNIHFFRSGVVVVKAEVVSVALGNKVERILYPPSVNRTPKINFIIRKFIEISYFNIVQTFFE